MNTTNLAESDEALQAFLADPSRVHFVSMLLRPRVSEAISELEHTHYPPGTPKNDDFHLRMMNWEGMQFVMASIPAKDRGLMQQVVSTHKLRIANGVPTMVGPDGVKRFPADNERVFTLEEESMAKMADAREFDADQPASFIRGLPLDSLRPGKERDTAHKLVDILKPFEADKRADLLKRAIERVGSESERAEWAHIQALPLSERGAAMREAVGAYELGKADGSAEARAEWARIQALPPHARAGALRAMKSKSQQEIAALDVEEAKLESERQLLKGIIAWLQDPLVLESPRGSAWHKLKEADQAGKLFKLETNGSGLGTVKFGDAEPGLQVFVVEHDWARAFANATDFEGGAVKMPFDICVFEFRISGRRVCLLAGQADKPDFLGSGVIFISGPNDAWCCLGPPQSDGPLSELLSQQVRAVCIALDAEVAVSEVERAPGKLNEARAKKGKLPLLDYHVVSLAARKRHAPLPADWRDTDPHRQHRLHFVRGHWRRYPNHRAWIKWHLRGNPDLGFIDKHYKL